MMLVDLYQIVLAVFTYLTFLTFQQGFSLIDSHCRVMDEQTDM